LTSLVCRAVDQLNPKSPKQIRESVIDDLLRYLDTDAVLFFAPQSQAEGSLLKMQIEEWTPLIQWASDAFDSPIHTRSGEVGIGQFAHQPEETKKRVRQWIEK
jgi:ATP synthase mitochondrial F1 complex assembly factor 2